MEQSADLYFSSYLRPYYFIRSKIANWRRDRKNLKIAKKFKKRVTNPYPDHGYRVVAMPNKSNGLGRAYHYEIERLKKEGLLNPNSRNVLILCQPRHYWKIFRRLNFDISETYRIGLWVTEFDAVPPDWAFALDIVNEIWTPSEFSANALTSIGIPISVKPHAVKVSSGPALERKQFGIPNDVFLGVAIMDLGTCPDRKNPLAHIEAWRLAFGDDPTARLLLKVRIGKRPNFVRRKLLNVIDRSDNIKLIEAEFDDDSMEAFQRIADVYISLHRSEGYGLNIHEMLLRGTPVIATAYSGNMTFFDMYCNAIKIGYKIVPYKDVTYHYRGYNLSWASPNITEAAMNLKKIRAKINCKH